MKSGMKALSLVFLACVLAFSAAACSKKAAGPKDEDVIKAITSAIESDPGAGTLQSPIVILERGTLSGEDFPVKVEYTVALPDGSTKKETVNYVLTSSINDMGVKVWLPTRK